MYVASSLHKYVSLSSTDSEYVALSEGCKIIAWMRQVLFELNCPQRSTAVYQDSNGALERLTGGLLERILRKKHVDVRHHYFSDMISRK